MPLAIPLYRREPRPDGHPRWGFRPSETFPEPFATILAPDDAEVARAISGDVAFFPWPGAAGVSARYAYVWAKEGLFGLTLLWDDGGPDLPTRIVLPTNLDR